MQLVIWFGLYVMLVLALAAWRNRHDSGVRASKNRPSTKGPASPEPVGGRERYTGG